MCEREGIKRRVGREVPVIAAEPYRVAMDQCVPAGRIKRNQRNLPRSQGLQK